MTTHESLNNVTSREIFKGGWLKKLPSTERRHSVIEYFQKHHKAEKMWVSLCVHEEVNAFLEFYENRRSAFSHSPMLRLSLARCIYVSPKISRCHEESDHVFAITFSDGEPVKLAAHSREVMMEWIDALRLKLRELGVLTPKDNPYSKEPESLRSPLARNPNSPLPPTPIFQFPPNPFDFREELSSIRSGVSPAPSLTLSAISGHSSIQSLNSVSSDPNVSPSVVTYVRPNHESSLNRRSSYRASLPSTPTSPSGSGSVNFVRSGPPPNVSSSLREHVTVISVPSSGSGSVFNFESVNAALESTAPPSSSQLNSSSHSSIGSREELRECSDPADSCLSVCDPNTVQLQVGNFVGMPANVMSAGGRPPRPPTQRPVATSFGLAANWCRGPENNAYEPIFLASSEVPSQPSTSHGTQASQAPNTGLMRRRSEHRRSGRREHARRAASVGPSIVPKQQYQIGSDGRLMSLREQQVIRLQREIAHLAGVRLSLRKKDCLDSIAFVNCFNHVYVAGWKQREHPYLHNTFHLGDRLMSVCGVYVTTASEAHNVIRSEQGMMIEFIIRRVPHGKVFNIKKETEGQSLGLVRDDNSAEIKDLVPGGLAEQHGVTQKGTAMDGLSLVSWVLTEINHRPLNLFFKHNEVTVRLNAVGRDISILIQPMDFVRQLKKQLKMIRSYKEFIVM